MSVLKVWSFLPKSFPIVVLVQEPINSGQWYIVWVHIRQFGSCYWSVRFDCWHDRYMLSPSQNTWPAVGGVGLKESAVGSMSNKIGDCRPRLCCNQVNCCNRVSQAQENDDCPLPCQRYFSLGSWRHHERCSELSILQPHTFDMVRTDWITKTCVQSPYMTQWSW